MNKDLTDIYKKEIADLYSNRSQTYDDSEWHVQIARKLVDLANIRPNSLILDIATGTGMLAFYAAEKTGQQGSVIGIDISEGMIEKARSKLKASQRTNLYFESGDGENLDFEPDSFDYIFCSSAFIWMPDLNAALTHWKSFLKPGGKVGFHAFTENSFVTGVVAQSVLLKYGVNYQMSKPTGTTEKCRKLLEQSGYQNISIEIDENGDYISLEEARNSWVSTSHPAPGQYPHPLTALSPEQLASARADYEQEIEKLNTGDGIWNDMTTLYVFAEK
jgi:ubiquinone/menaquinone biosynthesis C-methylase UbiE